MKLTGFDQKIDQKVLNRHLLAYNQINNIEIEELEIGKIMSYLNNSSYIFGITLAVFDQDNYTGPYKILCDGEWMWPGHYSYYIIKTKTLNKDFLNHIKIKEYNTNTLTTEQLKKATYFLETELLK